MTDLDIGDLESLLAYATAGPWEYLDPHAVGGMAIVPPDGPAIVPNCWDVRADDSRLIVALRNHAPELLRLARDGLRLRDLRASGAVTSMTAEEAAGFSPDTDEEEGQP